jgi:hypothetical protein
MLKPFSVAINPKSLFLHGDVNDGFMKELEDRILTELRHIHAHSLKQLPLVCGVSGWICIVLQYE